MKRVSAIGVIIIVAMVCLFSIHPFSDPWDRNNSFLDERHIEKLIEIYKEAQETMLLSPLATGKEEDIIFLFSPEEKRAMEADIKFMEELTSSYWFTYCSRKYSSEK